VKISKRRFLQAGSVVPAAFLSGHLLAATSESANKNTFVKPIVGSWFQFEHPNQFEGKHWNQALPKFTTEQWKTLVHDMHEIGFEYLVLLSVAHNGKAYYPSKLQEVHDFVCEDPMEAVLTAADECGIKFFVSNDYWSDWTKGEKAMKEEPIWRLREMGMEEIAEKYAHHKSFYGWYYPNESELRPIFSEVAVNYINRCSKIARSLTPNAFTMVAPYGTRYVKRDDQYGRQLEQLDVSIIAYQDEVGVRKLKVGEAGKYFEDLYFMHAKAGRARLWADVEVFDFEAEPYRTPAIPATFERILPQLADVSPYVENILIFQYQGFMNKPGTVAVAGRKDTEKLYTDYVQWLKGR
jgi:hypothetical protein